MIRGELRADGDRCPGCGRLLADADLSRVRLGASVNVLAICAGCRLPTIVRWSAEEAA